MLSSHGGHAIQTTSRLFRKTRHECILGKVPNEGETLCRGWGPDGEVLYEHDTRADGWGPWQTSDSDGYASRGSPWGKVVGLYPGMTATLVWYFVPTELDYQHPFHDFGEGWECRKQDLWPHRCERPDRQPAFQRRPLRLPRPPGRVPRRRLLGVPVVYSTWYAVAARNFVYPYRPPGGGEHQ